MTFPIIGALPEPPRRNEPEGVFVPKANAFLAGFPQMRIDFNAAGEYIEDKSAEVGTRWQETELNAQSAALSASSALVNASFRGEWYQLSGPLNTPASVLHNGKRWQLLQNLDNVALYTPGISEKWEEIRNKITEIYSMADLKSYGIGRYDGQQIELLGFYPDTPGSGGGPLFWDATRDKADHNGGTIIDPTHSATPGAEEWYATDNTGPGCWVRMYKDVFTCNDFGVIQSTSPTVSFQAALDAVRRILVPAGTIIDLENTVFPPSYTVITIDGSVRIQKHGYHAIWVDNVSGVTINGSGSIIGPCVFPANDIGGGTGGEKELCINTFGVWPKGTGSQDNGLGQFRGGFLGNGGCGVLVTRSDNINVDIDAVYGFNYAGICVGDPTKTSEVSELLSKNIVIGTKSVQDCYDSGVSLHCCDDVYIPKILIKNIGHPDAIISDAQINPGYGFTGRLVSDPAINARNVRIGSITAENCKRRGVDVHSGNNFSMSKINTINCWIAGVGIVRSETSNIITDDVTINRCGLATNAVVEAATAFSMVGESNTATNVNITDSGYTYSLYASGSNIKLSNIRINQSDEVVGRPVYAQNVSSGSLENCTVNGNFLKSLRFENANMETNLIDTRGMTLDGGEIVEITTLDNSSIDVLHNKHKTPQFYNGNTGVMCKRRISGNLTLASDFSTIVSSIFYSEGNNLIGSVTPGGSGEIIFNLLSKSRNYGTDGNSAIMQVTILEKSNFGGVKQIDHIKSIVNPTGDYQRISLFFYDSSGIGISSIASENINTKIQFEFILNFIL